MTQFTAQNSPEWRRFLCLGKCLVFERVHNAVEGHYRAVAVCTIGFGEEKGEKIAIFRLTLS